MPWMIPEDEQATHETELLSEPGSANLSQMHEYAPDLQNQPGKPTVNQPALNWSTITGSR